MGGTAAHPTTNGSYWLNRLGCDRSSNNFLTGAGNGASPIASSFHHTCPAPCSSRVASVTCERRDMQLVVREHVHQRQQRAHFVNRAERAAGRGDVRRADRIGIAIHRHMPVHFRQRQQAAPDARLRRAARAAPGRRRSPPASRRAFPAWSSSVCAPAVRPCGRWRRPRSACCSGQRPQSGLLRVHSVAPRSIRPCVYDFDAAVFRQQRFGAAPQRVLDRLDAGIGVDAEHAREHALDVAVQDGGARAARKTRRWRRPSSGRCRAGRPAAPGRSGTRRRIRPRRAWRRRAGCARGCSNRGRSSAPSRLPTGAAASVVHGREAFEEARVVAEHGGDLGLLQHDFGQPDAVGVARVLPRQRVAAMAAAASRSRRAEKVGSASWSNSVSRFMQSCSAASALVAAASCVACRTVAVTPAAS